MAVGVGLFLTSGVARADMGPGCGCELESRTVLGRAALATTFGVLGLGALFVERRRRRAQTRP